VPYVIGRDRKGGARYTAVYTDEKGRRKSAGTYDTAERAQKVAEQHESHVRLRLAETSPADKATITIQDFSVKFLREHAVEPNSKMTYAQLLNSHVFPFIGKRRVAEIGRETIHRLLAVVLPGGPGHYGMIFMPGTYRRTKDDIGRIVAALETKLSQYPGEEDLVNAEEWL